MLTILAMAKILVVEDDDHQADVIEKWLTHEHYKVDVVSTYADGKAMLSSYTYDAVVLDWGLPDGVGIDLIKEFRKGGGSTPILMLTGRSDMSDKEQGLDGGADDYLTKPFQIRELSARLRALMRRPSQMVSEVLSSGDLELDVAKHELWKNGELVKLFPQEFSLLEVLMRKPGVVHSTDALINLVWKSEAGASGETVRTSVLRLRRKIDTEGQPSHIENVHGVGYKFRQN